MAPFAFSAHPTEQQLTASLNAFLRPQYRLYRWMGAALVVLGALLFLLGDVFVASFAVLFGLACLLIIPPVTTRMVLRKMAGLIDRPTDYRIDDQGVWMGNDKVENLFRWGSVDRLEELPGMVLARLGKSGFYAVPTDGLPPETAAEVTAFLRAHVSAPAR
ncbi:YcxB family protein [Actinoplanes aureus]|uniref:YcxB family protein n=1 Tax=Actinoplanes aureus TaxID=2792083 RepID=A0A931C3H3_9ACTN|nr:YcxB family protein [Actinoplanes aureus]MBG0559867.1 YcxB family protein [Actinoplanes aureus]